jgi:hypothetical protein
MSNAGQFTSDRQPANRGRKKGAPNKTTTQLKEAILAAAEQAGGEGGLVKYLHDQARMNPGHFMTLLGKVLPMQVAGDKDAPAQLPRDGCVGKRGPQGRMGKREPNQG